MFSAAVYDADGKLVAVTKPSLFFVSEEGNTYYFPLEDYFDDSQIQELLVYGRGTSEPYLIEAKMEIESEKLLSLKLTSKSTGQKNIVWQWENKQETSDIKELDKDLSFSGDKMYYEKTNENISKYYVSGSLQSLSMDNNEIIDDYYVIILIDNNNKTFSVIPDDGKIFMEVEKWMQR